MENTMFTVTVDESMLEKLRGMLEDEDEGASVVEDDRDQPGHQGMGEIARTDG